MAVYLKKKDTAGDITQLAELPELTNNTPLSPDSTPAVGESKDAARADHVHKLPTLDQLGLSEDTAVVHKAGTEEITGTKTFTNAITTPNITFSGNKEVGLTTRLQGQMGVNDGWRIADGSTEADKSYLEIATRDNAQEAIYVRQYQTGNTLVREAALLDADGNTRFPGTLTVSGTKATVGGYDVLTTNGGAMTTNCLISGLGCIEFNTNSSSGHGGYLDFHYNGSTADYTSRIIESSSGTITVSTNLNVAGSLTIGGTSISMTPNNNGWQWKAKGTTYTATSNGLLLLKVSGCGHCSYGGITVNGHWQELKGTHYGSGSCGENIAMTLLVRSGDSYVGTWNCDGELIFIPAI